MNNKQHNTPIRNLWDQLWPTAFVAWLALWSLAAQAAPLVTYQGELAATRNGVTLSDSFTTLQPAGATVNNATSPFEPSFSGSGASLDSQVTEVADGISYGASSSGFGQFSSANQLGITDTILVEGDFTEYFLSFDILAGNVQIDNGLSAEQASFGFDVELNGQSIFDLSVDVTRDAGTGITQIDASETTSELIGFNTFDGTSVGASWERTQVLLRVELDDPSALDELLLGLRVDTLAAGDQQCGAAGCSQATANFDDPVGRFGRPVLRCLGDVCENDDPIVSNPVDILFDFGFGANVNAFGDVTGVTPIGPDTGTPVPTPGTTSLLLIGFLALLGRRKMKR